MLLLDRQPATAEAAAGGPPPPPRRARLVDSFGRAITYVRLSVTDRCNFRCVYCMSEAMTFLPHAELLSLEELDRLCAIFIRLGVRKIRVTGGEPLVRRGVMTLLQSLSRRLRANALDELTLTTNGSRLAQFAEALAACGVKRVNVSLDTLDAATFAAISRRGELCRGAGRRRSRRSRGAQGQDQRGGAEGRHRGMRRAADPLGARPGIRSHLHRGDAARRRPKRVVAAIHVAGASCAPTWPSI